ncbi:MAG TPA: MlaD family protein, partial [Cytophagaceae bacterium]
MSKEVKVGLLALVAGVILYIGFNFLKGVDFFSPTKRYYVKYDNIDGLTVSNPVILNGLVVGRVNNITLIPKENYKVVVELEIDDELTLGDSTYALLANTDLLGGKSIVLDIGKVTRV